MSSFKAQFSKLKIQKYISKESILNDYKNHLRIKSKIFLMFR